MERANRRIAKPGESVMRFAVDSATLRPSLRHQQASTSEVDPTDL